MIFCVRASSSSPVEGAISIFPFFASATRSGSFIAFAWASYGYGPETLDEADAVLDEFADVLEL